MRGLPRAAFHLEEDGKAQTISHFGSEDVPLELIVACDVSGSMAPAMSRLKTAVKEFLAAVPTRDQVTLIGFNDSIFALTRRASDPAERLKAVDRLAPWGATALYDVILRGVDMLGKQPGRRAIVIFSDGEDQGSHASITDVERRGHGNCYCPTACTRRSCSIRRSKTNAASRTARSSAATPSPPWDRSPADRPAPA